MSSTNEIGWFDELSKQIDEQAVVAMMIVSKARSVATLYGSTARDPDSAADQLWPVLCDVLTALVASQVDYEAVKQQYFDAESRRRVKAEIDAALAIRLREQQQESEAREQLRRSWELR